MKKDLITYVDKPTPVSRIRVKAKVRPSLRTRTKQNEIRIRD